MAPRYRGGFNSDYATLGDGPLLGDDDPRFDAAEMLGIPVGSVSPRPTKPVFDALGEAASYPQTPILGGIGGPEPLLGETLTKPPAQADDELAVGKGTTAGFGDTSWIDQQLADKREIRNEKIAATQTAWQPNDNQTAGTILGSLAAFAVGIAAGGGRRGLGLGLEGAGAVGVGNINQWQKDDALLKELRLKEVGILGDDINSLEKKRADIVNFNQQRSIQDDSQAFQRQENEKNRTAADTRAQLTADAIAKRSGRDDTPLSPEEADYVSSKGFPVKKDAAGNIVTTRGEIKRMGEVARVFVSLEGEERRSTGQALGEAQKLVAGLQLLPGKVPPKDVKPVREAAGAFNSMEYLAGELEKQLSQGTAWLGDAGQRQAALTAAITKAKANVDAMGANWTQMERDNVKAQLPAVGELEAIFTGQAKGQDPVRALQNFLKDQEAMFAKKILAHNMFLPGFAYTPKEAKRYGIELAPDGTAKTTDWEARFMSQVNEGGRLDLNQSSDDPLDGMSNEELQALSEQLGG